MKETVLGMELSEFVQNIGTGALTSPFVVCEESEPDASGKLKTSWVLYAVSPRTLVQVLTRAKTTREWRTLDGVVSDLRRKLNDFPPITIYVSVEAVTLSDLFNRDS